MIVKDYLSLSLVIYSFMKTTKDVFGKNITNKFSFDGDSVVCKDPIFNRKEIIDFIKLNITKNTIIVFEPSDIQSNIYINENTPLIYEYVCIPCLKKMIGYCQSATSNKELGIGSHTTFGQKRNLVTKKFSNDKKIKKHSMVKRLRGAELDIFEALTENDKAKAISIIEKNY